MYTDNDGDANNTTIRVPRANARGLGLIAAADPGADGTIVFNQNFNFDFNRADGITAGATDFVFVAAHEIGHLLGFVSGVDVLDGNDGQAGRPGPFNDNTFTFVSPLDLFRFSTQSFGVGEGTIDWAADNRVKFFSIDGGATALGNFSTGVNNGDGNQASHWQDNNGLGIMDPTAGGGELGVITPLDLRAFDVVGWNLIPTSLTPNPLVSGTTADNTFVLRRNPSDTSEVQVVRNGTVIATYDVNQTNSLTINGLDGNDTLTVDSSNGVITFAGGIRFNGGPGVDTLILSQTGGPTRTSDTYDVGPTPGSGKHTTRRGGGTQTVFFEDLAPVIDLVPAATLFVNATPAEQRHQLHGRRGADPGQGHDRRAMSRSSSPTRPP